MKSGLMHFVMIWVLDVSPQAFRTDVVSTATGPLSRAFRRAPLLDTMSLQPRAYAKIPP